MSIIGSVTSDVQKTIGGTATDHQQAVSHVMDFVNNHPGGLAGLVQAFHDRGLGALAMSWVGTGPNQPISPQQIQNVLGAAPVQALANKLGIGTQEAGTKLAAILPALINRLTPNDQVPQRAAGGLLSKAMDFLRGKQTPQPPQ